MSIPAKQAVGELTEYEILMGGAVPKAGVPPPSEIFLKAFNELSDPFYDAGPNDKGIGIQIGYSLYRVLTGYGGVNSDPTRLPDRHVSTDV